MSYFYGMGSQNELTSTVNILLSPSCAALLCRLISLCLISLNPHHIPLEGIKSQQF